MSFKSIYQLRHLIGTGHNSKVYLCINKKTKQEFACKIVYGPKVNKLTFDENNSMTCNHPNINTVHCVYYSFENGKNKKMIISELGEGDLFTFAETNKISERLAKNLIKQMTYGIDHIHEKNICHCDIKLENFIYNFDKKNDKLDNIKVKMIDFEFSRQFSKEEYITGRRGTPSYAAPELMKFNKYNHKVDIWSLGICSYMLLSKSNPIDKKMWIKHGKHKVNLDYENFGWKDRSNLSKDFVDCLLKINPEERYSIKKVLNHEWLTC